MQCTNCRFHNMPGSDVCGRCGTSLGLASATAIDVHPPRAGRMAKRLRRVAPLRRAYYGVRDAAGSSNVAVNAAAVTRRMALSVPPFPVFARLVVPGWSHFYLKQPWRGRLFLWGFLAFFLPGLLMLGTTVASICLGLAFSVHSSAALDITTQAYPQDTVAQRMGRSFMTSVVLFLVLYWPIGRLLTRVADPHTLEASIGPFQAGDVVLVNQMARPAVGSVVLYDIPEFTISTVTHGHQMYYTHIDGQRIDRILAGPGDDVRCENGAVRVNGAVSPLHPLRARVLANGMRFQVPANCYLILPSTTPNLPSAGDPHMWRTLSFVPSASIRGRVYVRSHPLTHLRWFH